MSIFSDLFNNRGGSNDETPEERMKRKMEEERERRRAKRDTQRAIFSAQDKIQEFEDRNRETWEKAREAIKAGRKQSARVELAKYRMMGNLISQFQKKVWILEFYQLKLDAASTIDTLTSATSDLSHVINLDPEKTINAMNNLQDEVEGLSEIDALFEDVFKEETRETGRRDADAVPSVDTLMNALETEAARELGGAAAPLDSKSDELASDIASGRERMKNLVDESDKGL